MSSRWNRLGFVAPVVVMGAALALGGCVDNDISLSVNTFVGPDTAMAASGICEYDISSVAITRGVFDAKLGVRTMSGYNANFSVANNLPTLSTEDVEMQAYYVSSFDVEIIPQGDPTASGHMAIPPASRKYSYDVASQRLAPGDVAFFSVQAISEEEAGNFMTSGAGSIEVRVRPVATRAEEQQHGAYATFPIDICLGCLTGTGNGNLPTCSSLKGQTPLVGNVCNYAQDEPVTCCTDKSNNLVCGTAVMNAESE